MTFKFRSSKKCDWRWLCHSGDNGYTSWKAGLPFHLWVRVRCQIDVYGNATRRYLWFRPNAYAYRESTQTATVESDRVSLHIWTPVGLHIFFSYTSYVIALLTASTNKIDRIDETRARKNLVCSRNLREKERVGSSRKPSRSWIMKAWAEIIRRVVRIQIFLFWKIHPPLPNLVDSATLAVYPRIEDVRINQKINWNFIKKFYKVRK